MNKALIIVDLQNDFVTGSLAIPKAKEIISVINWILSNITYEIVVETFDWHPENHVSFKEWPKHCVRYSLGAKRAENWSFFLATPEPKHFMIHKGTDINVDSYSGFFDDNHKEATSLNLTLTKNGKINELDIVGLATDYCVRFTALDAVKLGYKTNVLSFACRGVTPETTSEAIAEMKDNKINVI